ncbi:uncharacterized protein BCR38DRAFT_413369 [Pseudomassariella vexata]|uniref:Uncharacterized protein n=1 Tax=Pseudomassariella vexata TaxID=1141098 RepID=A0A1Y2DH12_9PEZI|nr:uncharacterized protein BCR38DRAFT_413369 [Pseudomassariella vexata]ORY58517.1 hypothetical protein BCR38DRAFT_413369 [Pseudomassariella vexata]
MFMRYPENRWSTAQILDFISQKLRNGQVLLVAAAAPYWIMEGRNNRKRKTSSPPAITNPVSMGSDDEMTTERLTQTGPRLPSNDSVPAPTTPRPPPSLFGLTSHKPITPFNRADPAFNVSTFQLHLCLVCSYHGQNISMTRCIGTWSLPIPVEAEAEAETSDGQCFSEENLKHRVVSRGLEEKKTSAKHIRDYRNFLMTCNLKPTPPRESAMRKARKYEYREPGPADLDLNHTEPEARRLDEEHITAGTSWIR